MAKPDPTLTEIATKLTRIDVDKSRGGYTLLDRRSRAAIARLKRFDGSNDFELFYWSARRNAWHTFGPLGRMRLTLDEVHDILQHDPMFKVRRSFWRRLIFG